MKCRPGGPPCDDDKVETHEKITNAKGHQSRHLLEEVEESPRCANLHFHQSTRTRLNSVHFHIVSVFKVFERQESLHTGHQIGSKQSSSYVDPISRSNTQDVCLEK